MNRFIQTQSYRASRALPKFLMTVLVFFIGLNSPAFSFGRKQPKPQGEPAITVERKVGNSLGATESGPSQSISSPISSISDSNSSPQKPSLDATSRVHANANELTVADFQALASSRELPNLRLVSGRILRGGQPSQAGLDLLKGAGVKTIINLRNETVEIERERQFVEALGLKFISIPMYPFEYSTLSQFQKFLNAVAVVESGPVYVHCQFGRDRTGTMIGAYRIMMENWTFDNAFKEMMACGYRPGLTQMTRGLHDLAVKRGDKSPLPSPSFVVSDLKSRFLKQRASAPKRDALESLRDADGLVPYQR